MKIYALPNAILTQNKKLIDTYNSLNSNSAFADTEMFKRELFDFSSEIRSDLGISNVISFLYDDSRESLAICIYPVESVIGATFEHGSDEKGFYILIDREGIESTESHNEMEAEG